MPKHRLGVSASSVKSWFQYRCERKFVYETMSRDARAQVPILEEQAPAYWALFGNDYEEQVVERLEQLQPGGVLRPSAGFDDLGERISLEFVRRARHERYAYQLSLMPTPALRRRLGDAGTAVDFRRGLVDLTEAWTDDSGLTHIRLIDIKSTQVATVFHKTQVAWYALMLESLIVEHGLSAVVDPEAQIWHLPGPGAPDHALTDWTVTPFNLPSHRAAVLDWAHRRLPRLAARRVERGRDETEYHVYFKCEQCDFLPHCYKSISDEVEPASLDLSAVAGLNHQSKRTLQDMGIRTVGEFAAARARLLQRGAVSDWKLATRGSLLLDRADALVAGNARRIDGSVSLRMPPRSDVAVFLVADRDPVEGRLVVLGCHIVEPGEEADTRVRAIRNLKEEREAIQDVLGRVVARLRATHQANQHGAARILHLFVFEAAESKDLAAALGRHLDFEPIRRGLIDLVRMFPPEAALPEPEYRGYHHLPACALRNVFEDTWALPAKVSFDLQRVSSALSGASPPPASHYHPSEEFTQHFSSRTPLAMCRELLAEKVRASSATAAAIEADAIERLDVMAALARWLEARNAELPAADQFLRLRKMPFSLQASVEPLDSADLDLLRAQNLLENRIAFLASLTDLAQPVARRRDLQSCFAGLSLLRDEAGRYGGRWLLFDVPPSSQDCDIRPGSPALILSDGQPDHVLDPSLWGAMEVKLQRRNQRNRVAVTVSEAVYEGEVFQALLLRLRNRSDWVLDAAHFDRTTDSLDDFLTFLSAGN